ncbi:hypothetical protein ISF_01067 [Cordyceps fumosorosea ARSEF 2679]|uniref:AMP-activated protein kinase glycogen-binding domain-containing protein n=1 Tax=Cordyceps fumosorosea (strain ARSEF 2679) TaxID=1081104 RepID=A0A168ESR7_CORFA|nr:hypothetical protein ISF_01067 [Cordyceps fumosorosea ARSEF 2679]OAA74166.1 hypothetical protein ISF_01067 [Cordyceps fumosorosea ARSEF 2679]
MSQPHTIPHTITYTLLNHDGPLFIAGTFSQPAWLLQEMEPSTPARNSNTYSICVMVEPDKEYQYRFRQGRDGLWAVDEREPIVKSVLGTKSNILRAKEPAKASNGNANTSTNINENDGANDTVSFTVPLFAHERLGAAYTLSDGSHQAQDTTTSEMQREISPRTMNSAPVDLNDPTLEPFPCDKSSILGTLRKIQSSMGEHAVAVDIQQHSNRRSSLDSDDGSSGSVSPSSFRRRENRLSNGSKRNLSVASLGSIAEEPNGGMHKRELRNIAEASIGDGGEALMMRTPKRQ